MQIGQILTGIFQGLCESILRQQGGGRAQGHLQTDRNRCSSNVPPGRSLPAKDGARDGGKNPLHLGHQVSCLLFTFTGKYICLLNDVKHPCIWTMMCRHPASGYVQGINDLVTPFLMVFLQVHIIFQPFLCFFFCEGSCGGG